MTPDHTPYLRPGVDLITAEDVLAWLDGLTSGPARERIYGVLDAHAALSLRLDRERRQACRRGALRAWRSFADDVRDAPTVWLHEGEDLFSQVVESDPNFTSGIFLEMRRSLSDALAFRAAARAR